MELFSFKILCMISPIYLWKSFHPKCFIKNKPERRNNQGDSIMDNKKKEFDLLSLGELLLRLSPVGNERLSRGDTLQKQMGGAELNVVSGASLLGLRTAHLFLESEIGRAHV